MKTTRFNQEANVVRRALLWRNRDFLFLWSGQGVSSLGTAITQAAYPLLVWDISHSAAMVGLIGGLGTLPYLLLSLIAGALIDRWERKRVMILCDVVRALNLGSVLLAVLLEHITIIQLGCNVLIEGTCYVFFNLAEVACLPRIVSREQLALATSQNEATISTTLLLGPFLGGMLYGLSRFIPFLADAISYATSVITLSLMRVPFQEERQRNTERNRLFSDILAGFTWLWQQPLIRYMAFLTGSFNLIGAGTIPILLVLVKQQQGSSLLFGTILSIGGIGSIIGALLGTPIQKRFRFGPIIISTVWISALLFPLYAVVGNPLFLGVITAGIFILAPIYNVVQLSYRLALIPDELQGRVNSVFRLLAFGLQPIGWALSGLFIQLWQVVPTILILSVWGLFLALLTLLNPHVRRASRL